MRRQKTPPRIAHWMQTADGDKILLEEVVAPGNNTHAVLLIHGLSGSADSQYIIGLQNLFLRQGITSIAMNFRGAKTPNNMARGYHSGASDDVGEVVNHLQQTFPEHHWHAMGFSLGGNALLKYLAENTNNPLHSATAVSVPLQLAICASQLDQGLSRVYRNHLLAEMHLYLQRKHQHLITAAPTQAKLLAQTPFTKKFSSFWEFDHEIIAPLHGFASAQDYYTRCSSGSLLKNIQTPTHILQALDDPFMTAEVLPRENELAKNVTLELSECGGHVGFYHGGGEYYVEELALQMLRSWE